MPLAGLVSTLTTGLLLVAGAVRRSWAAPVTVLFGAIYAILTPLGWIGGDDVLNVVYSDLPDNFIHLSLAIGGLGIGLAASPRCPARLRFAREAG